MKGRYNTENVLGKGKMWKKGQSGNPKGRPKLPDLHALLGKVLGQKDGDTTAAEKVLAAMYKAALKGDVRAAELLLERGWGKLGIRVDFTTQRQATADLFPDELKFFTTGGPAQDDSSTNIRQLPPYIREEADQSES